MRNALQEFKISTSSFAPEFGRTPGGQVSLVTRGGANNYQGNVFDYLRNTILLVYTIAHRVLSGTRRTDNLSAGGEFR